MIHLLTNSMKTSVVPFNRSVKINLEDLKQQEETVVKIYDFMGKLIVYQSVCNEEEVVIPVNQTGMMVVKTERGKQVTTNVITLE